MVKRATSLPVQTPMPILRHLHLSNLTTYAHASQLQETLVSRLLRYKATRSKAPLQTASASSTSPPPPPPPPPTILTFTPHPIYTTGRRETTPPTPAQLSFLKQPLQTIHDDRPQSADFMHALRGGQTTFHGPGQLVIYPILSLAHPYSLSSHHHHHHHSTTNVPPQLADPVRAASPTTTSLSPRDYIRLLESSTITTLAHYGIASIRTENPGVWIDAETKIAALGVHLRRNVTAHGVGLNVHTDLAWFDRIIACGLEGKRVTSMKAELVESKGAWPSMDEVAGVWVAAFARVCGLEEADVVRVTEEEVWAEGTGEGL